MAEQKYHLYFLRPEVREHWSQDDDEFIHYMPLYTIITAHDIAEAERLANEFLANGSVSLDGKTYKPVRQRMTVVNETNVKEWPLNEVEEPMRSELVTQGFLKEKVLST